MKLSLVKVGHWYDTTIGHGECVAVGGTFPPSARMRTVQPIPRGVQNVDPRSIRRELSPESSEALRQNYGKASP